MLLPLVLPLVPSTPRLPQPSLSPLSRPPPSLTTQFSPFKQPNNPTPRFSIQAPKCSASSSVVSEPTLLLELTKSNNKKPFPAEVSRTIMELSSVGTLSTITTDGWPLGIGVRFVVDSQGTPILCLQPSNTAFVSDDAGSTLHVQVIVFPPHDVLVLSKVPTFVFWLIWSKF